ncbi:hypothetical protein [uncultured Helicobacter sp.]|uniref:hypothetical protein n=1 Tax=uncultured Helicobacter sp. TaxID=175537 RepID=UPI001C3C0A7D|nr:hypothetical protein [Candidatus Helicobacter avicola]
MRYIVLIWQLFMGVGLAEWIMFSDGIDTYIYNNQSGEIFIRHHLGKQNYEDVFVKMPRGVLPNELKSPQKSPNQNPPPNPTDENLEQRKLDALKKSQEVLNNALEF